jgi:hypothetical protein
MESRRGARSVALRSAGALAALALLTACGPQAVVIGRMCVPANDGMSVVVDGFVQVGPSVDCDADTGEYRCAIIISEQPDDPVGNTAELDMMAGGDADQMEEPPSTFTKEGLLIRSDDGTKVAVGDRVRASGTVSTLVPGAGSAGGGSCVVKVDKLQRM